MTSAGPAATPARGSTLSAYLRRLVWWSMLPLLLLALGLAVDSVRRLRAADDRAAEALSTQLAALVEEALKDRIVALQLLAESPLLAEGRLADFHRRAQAFRVHFGGDLILGDDRGRMLLHSAVPFGDALPPLPRPGGRAAVPAALASGQPAVGDAFVGPINRKVLVAVAVPVASPDGRIEHVLLTATSGDVFVREMQQAVLQEGWRATLRDSQGQAIATIGPEAEGAAEAAASFVAPLRAAAWTVTVEVGAASRRAHVIVPALGLLAALAAATFAGLFAGQLGGRRLGRAVDTLSHAADASALPGRAGGVQGGAAGVPSAAPAEEGGIAGIAEIDQARHTLAAAVAGRDTAVATLQRTDATLRALFDGIPDAVVMVDPERRIRNVNPAFKQMFGYTLDEVAGRTPEFLYADAADYARAGRDRFNADAVGEGRLYEMRYRRRDGSEVWGESVAVRIFAAGELVGMLGVHRDITARRNAEEGLRQSVHSLGEAHRRFATLFESAPVAMVVGRVDDGRFVEVNAAFEALSGHRRAEVVGRPSSEFGMWPEVGFRESVYVVLAERGSMSPTEARLCRRDGVLVEVSFSACVVQIEGEPHFVAMIVDNTAQVQARRLLEQQQQELESLVARRTAELEAANATLAERAAAIADLYDNAPCGYHSLAMDGTITAVNATEAAMLGYPPEAIIGQPATRFLTPASRAKFLGRLADFPQVPHVRGVEYELVRKDGSVLPVLIDAVAMRDAEGRHVAYRATMVDNSERKARERQIEAMQHELARRAEEAEAANRAKSAFRRCPGVC